MSTGHDKDPLRQGVILDLTRAGAIVLEAGLSITASAHGGEGEQPHAEVLKKFLRLVAEAGALRVVRSRVTDVEARVTVGDTVDRTVMVTILKGELAPRSEVFRTHRP